MQVSSPCGIILFMFQLTVAFVFWNELDFLFVFLVITDVSYCGVTQLLLFRSGVCFKHIPCFKTWTIQMEERMAEMYLCLEDMIHPDKPDVRYSHCTCWQMNKSPEWHHFEDWCVIAAGTNNWGVNLHSQHIVCKQTRLCRN